MIWPGQRKYRFCAAILISLAGLCAINTAQAKDKPSNRIVAGWVENIMLKNSGDVVKAKLDTGAKTSSINAVDIKHFRRDGQKWVRFSLVYPTAKGKTRRIELEKPLRRSVRVKEHESESMRRAVVDLQFCFAGQWRQAQFSLVDRSKFLYPVLLGRRFLQNHALIDPSASFLSKPNCSPGASKHE